MNYQEKYPHLKAGATKRQVFDPFIELAKTGTKEEQQSYLSAVVLFTQTLTKETVTIETVSSNVVYWAWGKAFQKMGDEYEYQQDIKLIADAYYPNHPVYIAVTSNF